MHLKILEFDISAFRWVTIASLSMFVFFAAGGILSLPYVIMPEILPQKVKLIKNYSIKIKINMYFTDQRTNGHILFIRTLVFRLSGFKIVSFDAQSPRKLRCHVLLWHSLLTWKYFCNIWDT